MKVSEETKAARARRAQYGRRGFYPVPVTLYGPRDNFDPHVRYVSPALTLEHLETNARREPKLASWEDRSVIRQTRFGGGTSEGIGLAIEQGDSGEPVAENTPFDHDTAARVDRLLV